MKKIRQFALFVILLSFLAGCAPTLTSTPIAVPPTHTAIPSTPTAVLPTSTVVLPTSTALSPTATLQSAATPASEVPRILWDKTYGKTGAEMGEDVLVADDGGFYILGTTKADLYGTGKTGNLYLIRTDEAGEVLWEKTYGGETPTSGLSITRAADGNLLLAGTIQSSTGGADVYLVKIDPEGNPLWSQTFGGPLDERVLASALPDGGFMLWGNSVNLQDIVADPGAAGYGGYAGRSNIYIAKVDAAGTLVWSKTFGGQNNLLASGGVPAADGGFVVLSTLLRYPEPGDDLYLLKVDANGNQVWERTWGEGSTAAYDLIHTADDQYLIAASSAPAEDKNHSVADFLFIKVDEQGQEVWLSTFGDPNMLDYPMSVAQTADGGYLAAGDWVKDFSGANPARISLTKIDANGQLQWEKTVQPSGRHNVLRTWLQLADGNFLLVGSRFGQKSEIYLLKVAAGEPGSAYLGQMPPGLDPQVFAPGIVSIPGMTDYAGSFSADGTEFYFTRGIGKQGHKIYETHLDNGVWTTPIPISFAVEYDSFEPHVTLDNQTLYFAWFHPLPPGESSAEGFGIWAVDRIVAGWSEPRYVGQGMFVSSDRYGQIYVTDNVMRSLNKVTLTAGRFTKLETIGPGIHPAIAPDGSYLVFDNGSGNFRVKFRLADGSWGAAKDLTANGLPASASIASISPGRLVLGQHRSHRKLAGPVEVNKIAPLYP